MIKHDNTLYEALETALKECKQPATCADLFMIPRIRRLAESNNRVSDYLGNMWRKGQLLRYPAPKDASTAARWMYAWKPQIKRRGGLPEPIEAPVPHKLGMIEVVEGTNDVIINLPDLQIIFRPKK